MSKVPYLRHHLLTRAARRRVSDYDLAIGCGDVFDFGHPTIQYIHFPYKEHPWRGSPWAPRALYVAFCRWLSGFSYRRMCSNETLVNSHWTGEQVRRIHGIESRVLYPPAVEGKAPLPWAQRKPRILCVGRMCEEKRQHLVIKIVEKVRGLGVPVRLVLVGSFDPGEYQAGMRRMIAERSDWIDLHENLSRADLDELLATTRYGIHAMVDEHFGMAPAEMVQAGCLVFVHDSGGQVEVVDGEPRLRFGGVHDAVEKIATLLVDPEAQARLLRRLARGRTRFSADRFCQRFRALVEESLARLRGSSR